MTQVGGMEKRHGEARCCLKKQIVKERLFGFCFGYIFFLGSKSFSWFKVLFRAFFKHFFEDHNGKLVCTALFLRRSRFQL